MSKLTIVRVLAVVLAIALLGFGIPALHAKDKDSQHGYSSSCPAPKEVESCPAPKKVESCAPAVVQPEPVCNSCPVDPKKVRKAEKEAEHAQHEAAEECERNHKKIAKEQQKAAEEQAEANEHMAKANELATSGPSAMCCPSQQPVAEAQPTQPEPSIAIITPLPEPTPEVTPAPTPEVTLPPPPAPIAEAQPPKELPRTASPMSLIGLIGLLSMSGSLTGFFRRR
jgi:LPXTG-motif cell wall-anchored protein